MMTSTDRINAWNRGIIEYQPCSIDAFFTPDRGVYNAVISGGENKMRVKAMAAQAICAVKNNFPVVILHEGNYELEDQIRNVFGGNDKFVEVNFSSASKTNFDISNRRSFDISISERFSEIIGAAENTSKYALFK